MIDLTSKEADGEMPVVRARLRKNDSAGLCLSVSEAVGCLAADKREPALFMERYSSLFISRR